MIEFKKCSNLKFARIQKMFNIEIGKPKKKRKKRKPTESEKRTKETTKKDVPYGRADVNLSRRTAGIRYRPH
jgi:hypothetical protein